MTSVGSGLEGVVVARVLGVRPHPNADRVRLCDVDPGDGEPIQVACGAPNVAPGQLVPLATVGAVLPDGTEIGRRKLRGEWSNGMICSPAELGLGDEAGGIMVLPEGLAVGVPVGEALGITRDVVYDLAIETNRPDAMCVAGVARDVAARLRLPFSLPEPKVIEGPSPSAAFASAAVEAPELCPRFTAKVLADVAVGPSPEWLVGRLTLAGMRALSNVVDASNYVMLELGQPSHPYDLDRLAGAGLSVRAARPGEALETLDGKVRTLGTGKFPDALVCDAEGQPVGIAGILGGASSEIDASTRRVLLEAAVWTPMAIARTAKRLGLRTEASARFERGVDPEGVERAVARFCSLVQESSPSAAVAHGLLDVRAPAPPPAPVRLRTARVNAVLGTGLTDEEVRGYLEPIGFGVRPAGPGVAEVTVPTFRPDTEREIDVIEEVARHHGYSRIPRTRPPNTRVGALSAYQHDRRRVRDVLAGERCDEAWTTSLLGPGDAERAGLPGEAVEVDNPLAAEESLLRTSLLPGLLRALALNRSHRNDDVRLFEVGHVFGLPPAGETRPVERERAAVALARPGDDARTAVGLWRSLADALRLEGVAMEAAALPGLHPMRSARLVGAGGTVLGAVGEVDPGVLAAHDLPGRVGWLDVDLEALLAQPRRPVVMRPVSRYPSSDVDLAFVVPDEIPAAAVEAALRDAGGDLLVDLALFDVHRSDRLGPGRRSLAYRLRFQAPDRTLTDAEVAAVRRRGIEAVAALGGALRG